MLRYSSSSFAFASVASQSALRTCAWTWASRSAVSGSRMPIPSRSRTRSSAACCASSALARRFLMSSAFSCRILVSREDGSDPSPPEPVVADALPLLRADAQREGAPVSFYAGPSI